MASPRQGVCPQPPRTSSFAPNCSGPGWVSPDAALSLDLVDSVGSLVDGNQQQLLSLDS